tara:strand:- start:16710 stop:17096 length:387 start_codon:yes stop_codon:yes gene_type:complete
MVRYNKDTYNQEKYEQDMTLIDRVEIPLRMDFTKPEQYILNKEDILRDVLHFKGLRVSSNKSYKPFLSLDKSEPWRINEVLRKAYIEASKRVKKFGDPSKRVKKKSLLDHVHKMKEIVNRKGTQLDLF